MIKSDKRQQELLTRFFAEETTWFPEHVGLNLITCIFVGISLIILVPPYSITIRDDRTILFTAFGLYNLGIAFYGNKFSVYPENSNPVSRQKQSKNLYDILRYLPVDRREFKLFRLKKIGKPCLYLTICILILRILLSLYAYHTISIPDFFLLPCITLIMPLLINIIETVGESLFYLLSAFI